MKPDAKLRLELPHKLALPGAPKADRMLMGAAHMALALNATTIFFGAVPLGGIFAAIVLCSVVYLRRSPFAREASQQGFQRCLLAFLLVMAIHHITQNVSVLEYWSYWSLLFIIQTPLSAYDAWRMRRGEMGLKLVLKPKSDQLSE